MKAVGFLTAAELRRAWRTLVLVGIVAGLTGGVAMALVVGARRTATAPERLVEAADSPNLQARVYEVAGGTGDLAEQLGSAPQVARSQEIFLPVGRTAGTLDWFYPTVPLEDGLLSPDSLRAGRLPDPDAAEEVAVSVTTAEKYPLGSTVDFTAYAAEQAETLITDSNQLPEGGRVVLRVVGVVADPLDTNTTASLVYGTPALAPLLGYGDDAFPAQGIAIWLEDEPGAVEAFDDELDRIRTDAGPSALINTIETDQALASLTSSSRVLIASLLVLAGLVLTAGLVAASVLYARGMVRRSGDLRIGSGLGLARRELVAALALPGVLSVVSAVVVALPVAYLASDRFPTGRIAVLEPQLGREVNVAVLAACTLALVAVLVALGLVLALRSASRLAVGVHVHHRQRVEHSRPAISGVLGSRLLPWIISSLAFGRPGRRRRGAIPVRSAVAGVALAVTGVAAVGIFTTTARHNVQDHLAYGVPWDLGIEVSEVDQERVVAELADDPDIDAVGRYSAGVVTVGDESSFGHHIDADQGEIPFTLLEGRTPFGRDEVALGPDLLDRLGLELGDTTTIGVPAEPGTPGVQHEYRVVGAALHPGARDEEHGAEAVFSDEGWAVLYPDLVPEQVVVRYADGVDSDEQLAALDERYPSGVQDESTPQRPGKVETLAQIGALPPILGWTLAVLGFALMANALVATTRLRAHDLAVLRGLGVTPRLARHAVLGMATVQALVGLVIGLPLGIILGRVVWRSVAEQVQLSPSVPLPWPALVALVGLVLVGANLAALWPAVRVSRRTPAELLRSE
jgi:hypothetical protein